MRRLLPWALLAASLAANVAMAVVGSHSGGPAPQHEPPIFARVSLEPDQRARISSLRSDLLARREVHQREIMELRNKLAAAVTHEPEDRAAVESILANIADAQAGFQRAMVDHILAVRSVLKPDQRPAFESLVANQMQAGGQSHCGLEPPADERP
jgi:Spy/CpxP family protein refolding chaperone